MRLNFCLYLIGWLNVIFVRLLLILIFRVLMTSIFFIAITDHLACEYVMEAGTLLSAQNDCCCIDEFGKSSQSMIELVHQFYLGYSDSSRRGSQRSERRPGQYRTLGRLPQSNREVLQTAYVTSAGGPQRNYSLRRSVRAVERDKSGRDQAEACASGEQHAR